MPPAPKAPPPRMTDLALIGGLAELSGLVSHATGMALAALAAKCPPHQAIVELGSYKGKSAAYLAAGARAGRGAPVHAVDAWDLPGNTTGRHGYAEPGTYEAFCAQLRQVGLWAHVTPHRGWSVEVAAEWPGPEVGLLYIDAGHEEENVRADLEAWLPHLAARGATIAFDDYRTPRNPGVALVVDSLPWPHALLPDALAVVEYR